VFEDDQTLRHLAFFEAVASHEEHEADWRAATAGLVTLRLVDQWVDEGPEVVEAGGWCTRAVVTAIEQMDEGSRVPSILLSILSAMQAGPGTDAHGVLPRLLAYARALEYEAKWPLAVDVYETVAAYAHPIHESESAIAAHHRRGICLRTMGAFTEAVAAFATASAVANGAGDMMGVLRARIADAKVAVARGNLPRAEAVLDDTIAQAAQLHIPVVHSEALHDRAMVAGLRGRHDLAIEFAYEALRESTAQADRDRILNDIGTAFHMLGLRSGARDAFLLLSATAQEQYMRWVASLSLMAIAAEDGSEPIFEQYRAQVKVAELPPELETEYYLRLGQAYRQLDHDNLGQIALARAVQLAEHYGYFGLLFEAEDALKARPAHRLRPSDMTPELTDIAAEVRNMRVAALTST
jgi:tetratricopeptide (TPR) repeat protein